MDGGGRLARPLTRPATRRPARGRASVLQISRRSALGRLWTRLNAASVPRFAGLVATTAFLGATVAFGIVRGGHLPTVSAAVWGLADRVAVAAGFGIAEITLTGQAQTGEDEILATAGITPATSLLFLDAATTRARLESNPWIAQATVRKLYPDRLIIEVVEREPFALWQSGGRIHVIDAGGNVIAPLTDLRHARLPLVVGPGAEKKAREFLAVLERVPHVRDQVRAAVFVGERRWNLRLRNGIDVRLPAEDIEGALNRLVELDRTRKLMTRDVVSIDMRLADRVAVRLSPEAAQAREDAVRDRRRIRPGEGRMTLRDGLAPKMRPLHPRRTATVAALDVGTHKIVCTIARLRPREPQDVLRHRTHLVEIVGLGHVRSAGVKGGAIVDLDEAEEAIRQAVDAAERAAGVQIEAVIVGLSAGRVGSECFSASIDIVGTSVADGDIQRVLAAGSRHSVKDGRVVVHSLPIGFALDAMRDIQEPRGMLGRSLGVEMHVVTADAAAASNLMLVVERCHLAVEALVATPYMSALAVLSDDEADLGVAVVDMGAGTTTVAAFSGGHCVSVDGIAVGGRHVTMDLARGLSIRVEEAERLKALHGSVMGLSSDDREAIRVPGMSDDRDAVAVSRGQIVRIVRPRVEEILEFVRDRLAAGHGGAARRVVLTGGAVQLTGLADLAADILGRPVRIGRPLGVSGLPEAAKGPAFAAAAGLLVYPQVAEREHYEPRRARPAGKSESYLSGVARWLRESF